LSTDVSEALAASIIRAMNLITLKMEAARTSETSVDNYFTRQYIPQDKSELHTRRRENLKSHIRKTNLDRTELQKEIVLSVNSNSD
jgi:hypothetical protein